MTERDLNSMSVNERLFTSGLLEEFDRAVTSRDIERVRRILMDVSVSDEDIEKIIKKVMKPE